MESRNGGGGKSRLARRLAWWGEPNNRNDGTRKWRNDETAGKNSKSLKMESRNGGKFSKILKEGIKERQNSGFPKRQNNGKSPEILLIKDPRNDGKSAVIKGGIQSCQRGREYLKERKEWILYFCLMLSYLMRPYRENRYLQSKSCVTL